MTTSCYQLEPRGDAHVTVMSHFPSGVMWHAVRMTGKWLYKFVQAVSDAYEDMSEALCNLATELNPYATTQLITEWETAVGLPDPCLPVATTLEQRRSQVIFRLTKRRWTTEADYHALAALFGLTIRITQGWTVQKPALFDACFDQWFFNFPRLGRFYIFIDITEGCGSLSGFDYNFDYNFETGLEGCELFMCIMERVKPASVVILWNKFPAESGWLTCGE